MPGKGDGQQQVRTIYDRNAPRFDAREAMMERMLFGRWREKLWSQVRGGEILELGTGTGKNIPYYPAGTHVVGIDFSPGMLDLAMRKWPDSDLRVMDVQSMDFTDDSFDAVVATCVFCSVPDPLVGLAEARRVCRPGGRLFLLEHVRSENWLAGPVMDLLNPVWVSRTGANINRETLKNVRDAGFQIVAEESLLFDVVKLIVADPAKGAD